VATFGASEGTLRLCQRFSKQIHRHLSTLRRRAPFRGDEHHLIDQELNALSRQVHRKPGGIAPRSSGSGARSHSPTRSGSETHWAVARASSRNWITSRALASRGRVGAEPTSTAASANSNPVLPPVLSLCQRKPGTRQQIAPDDPVTDFRPRTVCIRITMLRYKWFPFSQPIEER
jgi:hypothetical protein